MMGDGEDEYNCWRRGEFRGEQLEYRGAGESGGRREDRDNPIKEEWTVR